MTRLTFGATVPCHRCAGRGKYLGKPCLICKGSGYMGLPIDPEFDGETYEPVRDGEPSSDRERLSAQLAGVRAYLMGHEWVTLAELAQAAQCSTQSASARVRDLRKEKFGGHTIARRYLANGLFIYRLER